MSRSVLVFESQVEFENLTYSRTVSKRDLGVPNVLSPVLSLSKSGSHTVAVLQNCSGILVPGSMTLLLAPAKHGSTSLMKVLAGRIPMNHVDGEVLHCTIALAFDTGHQEGARGVIGCMGFLLAGLVRWPRVEGREREPPCCVCGCERRSPTLAHRP